MRLADCHPNRKHKAKGFCGACHESYLKDINPTYKKKVNNYLREYGKKHKERLAYDRKRYHEKRKLDPQYKLKSRESMLLNSYGITNKIYSKILESQGGGCALCNRKPAEGRYLHVDHCHKELKIRGILCHQCNWYMGTVDSDPSIIDRIIKYRRTYVRSIKTRR